MLALALSPAASASPLLTLRDDGSTFARDDPYLPATGEPPSTTAERRATVSRPPREPAARAARAAKRTVHRELRRMLAASAIDRATYDARMATYRDARRLHAKLRGARRNALGAVLANLDAIAARGDLTVSRLP